MTIQQASHERQYRCEVHGLGVAYYDAATASKARYRCFLALRDAGYRKLSFRDIRVRLARVSEEVIDRFVLNAPRVWKREWKGL